MQNAGYILAAFSIIWAVLFGYVLVLITREARLRRDIKSLKENLREKEQ
jgi:CcmD family protein